MSVGDSDRPVVFVHIGGPKTGTTYLQELLWTNRAALRQVGLLYPGRGAAAHFMAAQDLTGHAFHGHQDSRIRGAWPRLVEEVRGWPGTSVISHEVLALTDPEAISRAHDALAFADVHVIFTARDLARQIPSVWQEDLKNRHALTFRRMLRGLRDDDPDPPFLSRLFWRFQDPVPALARWAAALPPERVHVVTVPPPGADPGLLWERFAATIGLDPRGLELTLPTPANQSMGVVEANLLRRLNVRLGRDFDWPVYEQWVKAGLAGHVLAARPGKLPLRLPAEQHEWVTQRARRMCAELAAAGYDVVGDLDDLVPSPPEAPARHPDRATDAELVDAAVHALAALIRTLAGVSAPQAPDQAESTADDPPPPAELPAMMLFRLGVQRLSRDHGSVARLRSAYATVKNGAAQARRR